MAEMDLTEAIEAATRLAYEQQRARFDLGDWDTTVPEKYKAKARQTVARMFEAAAPFIAAQALRDAAGAWESTPDDEDPYFWLLARADALVPRGMRRE